MRTPRTSGGWRVEDIMSHKPNPYYVIAGGHNLYTPGFSTVEQAMAAAQEFAASRPHSAVKVVTLLKEISATV